MEPITILIYLLNGFFCYSICTDIQNYRKFQSNHYEQMSVLNSIETRVSNIETKIK